MSREAILRAAVSIMELSHRASTTGPFASRVGWWSATFVQWHPLAVALAELCHYYTHTRPGTSRDNPEMAGEATDARREEEGDAGLAALVDRAWAVVEAVFPLWADRIADTKRGTLWRPIRKLYRKAKAARAAALSGGAAVGVPATTDTTTAHGGTSRVAAGSNNKTSAFYDQTTPSNPNSNPTSASGSDPVPPRRHHAEPTPTPAASAMLDIGSNAILPQPPPIPPSTSAQPPAMSSEPWFGPATMSAPQQHQHQHQHPQQHHPLPLQQYPIPPPNSNADDAAGAATGGTWFGDSVPWPDINFDLLSGMDGGVGVSAGTGWDAMDWSTWDEFVDDTYAEGPLTSSSDGS